VWDALMDGWRPLQAAGRRQLFALVATEPWEVHAVLYNSCAMQFHSSTYLEQAAEQDKDEQQCVVCWRHFNTKTAREVYGCSHVSARVVCYRPSAAQPFEVEPFETDVAGVRAQAQRVADAPFHARWLCCGKPFLEPECPLVKHTLPARLDRTTRKPVHMNVDNSGWWCNLCCQSVAADRCTNL
jgi:hypothetical protein